jgi:hypothetical protein
MMATFQVSSLHLKSNGTNEINYLLNFIFQSYVKPLQEGWLTSKPFFS